MNNGVADKNKIRLNKAIAMSGYSSRRKADDLIQAGRVKINGEVVKDLGYKISFSDKVTVNDIKLIFKKNVYLLFYKPVGYITTTKDEHGRKTIYDLLPVKYKHLNPVGRLDRDSEGLLLLSNDGHFINQILHPSHNIKKTYVIKINSLLGPEEVDFIRNKLISGVNLNGQIHRVDSVKELRDISAKSRKQTIFEAVIHEGINRQIRRMFQLTGFSVSGLMRTKIGKINLGNLKRGDFKELSKETAYAILRS